jgi:hypothetical protein
MISKAASEDALQVNGMLFGIKGGLYDPTPNS